MIATNQNLMMACAYQNPEQIAKALSEGGDLFSFDEFGNTPLMHAVRLCRIENIKFIMKHLGSRASDVANMPNHNNISPISYAFSISDPSKYSFRLSTLEKKLVDETLASLQASYSPNIFNCACPELHE